MTFVIHPIDCGPFFTTNEVPETLNKYYVPGSRITVLSGSFGTVLIQQIILEDFSWHYLIFDMEKDASFRESFDSPVVCCLLVLEGSFDSNFNPAINFNLASNQFTVVSMAHYRNNLHLKKTTRYVFVRMLYPKDYITYTLSFFPALETFKKNLEKQKAVFLVDHAMYADAKILDLVYQLVHSFYSVNVQLMHIAILKDIFMSILKYINVQGGDKNKFSIGYIERIHQAKDFIDRHLPAHYSIPHIAHTAGINEQRLKHGFKEIYGMGLYAYLREQILAIAKIQVEETNKSIKEIAYDAGFKNQGNFSSAFKKRYGYSPNERRAAIKSN